MKKRRINPQTLLIIYLSLSLILPVGLGVSWYQFIRTPRLQSIAQARQQIAAYNSTIAKGRAAQRLIPALNARYSYLSSIREVAGEHLKPVAQPARIDGIKTMAEDAGIAIMNLSQGEGAQDTPGLTTERFQIQAKGSFRAFMRFFQALYESKWIAAPDQIGLASSSGADGVGSLLSARFVLDFYTRGGSR